MDATTLNTIVGIIGIVVGLIGVVVGVIGWKNITTANNIKNRAKADNGATIQQAQTINNGMDSYAVIRLSKDTTQEELVRLVKELNMASKNDVSSAISKLEEKVDALPKIHVGPTEPDDKSVVLWINPDE